MTPPKENLWLVVFHPGAVRQYAEGLEKVLEPLAAGTTVQPVFGHMSSGNPVGVTVKFPDDPEELVLKQRVAAIAGYYGQVNVYPLCIIAVETNGRKGHRIHARGNYDNRYTVFAYMLERPKKIVRRR